MIFAHKLTNLQLELIRLFAYQLPETQITEIKEVLARYFAEKATQEMDKLWEEKQWNDDTMNNWLEEHNRTPYND